MYKLAILFAFTCYISGCGGGNENGQKNSPAFESTKWIEYPQPILMAGPFGSWNELKGDTGNTLLNENGKWLLYHSGQNSTGVNLIGVHVSYDSTLVNGWSDYLANPVLVPGATGEWDDAGVAHPAVLERQGEYFMYYSGFGSTGERVGLAKSVDGFLFTKQTSSPVLSPGLPGEWDDGGVDQPSVIHVGEQYVMAYRGWALGIGFTDTHSQIGIATSSDGISFRKNPDNPIMKYGPLNSWDEYGLLAPRLWFDADGYHMNYSGKSNGITSKSASSIGHAFATKLNNWTKSSKNPIIFSGDTKWHELEWGTVIKDGVCWKMLTTAWVEGGVTVLWNGLCK